VPPEEFPSAFSMPLAPDVKALLALTGSSPQVTDQDQHLGWAVLDALPTAVAVIGADGTILATNVSWKRLVLQNRHNPSYHSVGANYLTIGEQSEGLRAAEATLFSRGRRAVLAGERDDFTMEYDADDDDGAHRFLLLISPVVSRKGGAVVVRLDITARHVAEQALVESEERFRSIFDQAPLGIFRLGTDGRVVDANRARRTLSLPLLMWLRLSPPLAFDGTVGAACSVQCVEMSHVRLRKREVENLGVLGEALTMGRFGQDGQPVLDAPPEQYLSRCTPAALGDAGHRFI